MKKTGLLFLGLFFSNSLFAQQISGKIVDTNTKKPIENAYVFVENTQIYTFSKTDGSYQIDLKGSKNNIIFDYFGYDMYLLNNNGLDQKNTEITLNPTEEILQELVINKSPFSRKEMMKAFKKYFLGTTSNGKSCKIKNEKDLILYFDAKTNTLYAESKEPLIVENKNLDYEVIFYMTDFQASFRARSLDFFNYVGSYFVGHASYKDINTKSTHKNREKTYENGTSKLFIALAEDKLVDNKLTFYVNKFPINEKEYFKTEKKSDGYTLHIIKSPTKKVPKLPKKGEKLIIGLSEPKETEEVVTDFNIFNSSNKNQSIMQLNADRIDIDKNGNLLNPNQVFFGGYYGNLKFGDMLPTDYKSDKK